MVSMVVTTGDFSETDTCTTSPIAVNQICSIQIRFLPTTTGIRSGLLTVYGNVSGGQERHHPLQVAIPQFRAIRHGSFAQQMFEINIAVCRVWCVRADEKGRSVLGNPVRELAGPAIERIEKNQAADARSDTAPVEDRQGRSKAPAIGNDHDRHLSEREYSARVAIHSCKLNSRFIKEEIGRAHV